MATPSGKTEKEITREALINIILALAEEQEKNFARYRAWWPEMLREYKENRRHREKS